MRWPAGCSALYFSVSRERCHGKGSQYGTAHWHHLYTAVPVAKSHIELRSSICYCSPPSVIWTYGHRPWPATSCLSLKGYLRPCHLILSLYVAQPGCGCNISDSRHSGMIVLLYFCAPSLFFTTELADFCSAPIDGANTCNLESCCPLQLESLVYLQSISALLGVAGCDAISADIFTTVIQNYSRYPVIFWFWLQRQKVSSHALHQILNRSYLQPYWLLGHWLLILRCSNHFLISLLLRSQSTSYHLALINKLRTTLKLENQPVASINVVSSLGSYRAPKAEKTLTLRSLFQLFM